MAIQNDVWWKVGKTHNLANTIFFAKLTNIYVSWTRVFPTIKIIIDSSMHFERHRENFKINQETHIYTGEQLINSQSNPGMAQI